MSWISLAVISKISLYISNAVASSQKSSKIANKGRVILDRAQFLCREKIGWQSKKNGTLESEIDVPPWINEASGKFDKKTLKLPPNNIKIKLKL